MMGIINLKTISLITSIIGIFMLLLFLNIQDPKPIKISSINEKQINKHVTIQGQLIRAYTLKGDFTALIIKDNTGSIEIVCNCPDLKNQTNQNMSITGKISEYNNQLQIQADKIMITNSPSHS